MRNFGYFSLVAALIALPQILFSQTTDSNMSKDSSKIVVGKDAPDFTLPDQSGKLTHLRELRGSPIVLYFYPKDFTPGCTKEACDFRDNFAPLKKAGAVVLGVSPDAPDSHTKFIAHYELPFTLLSDTTHDVLKTYGAWGLKKNYGKEYEGVIRSTVLISADGKVAGVWPEVKVEGHVESVLAAIKTLPAAKPK